MRNFETKGNTELSQLICKKGCGGLLVRTEDTDIFRCQFCNSLYLVRKTEDGSLVIVRELKVGLENVASLQLLESKKTGIEREKDRYLIRLHYIEDRVRSFGPSAKIEKDEIRFCLIDEIFSRSTTRELSHEYRVILPKIRELNKDIQDLEDKIANAKDKTLNILRKNKKITCSLCGLAVSSNTNFCRHCGAEIKE
ncbi:hypothetical protein KKC91_03060 [bacterium]|nr:hypothetical protein [bacterium]